MNRNITFAAAAAIAALSGFAAHANAGADQLAARAGVEAGAYSVNELTRIAAERHESNRANSNRLNFELGHGGAEVGRAGAGGALSAGEIQLAARAGVEPGVYSLNELTRLIAESHESGRGNDNRSKLILDGGNDTVSRASDANALSDGERQLAARAGVEPGEYSVNALTRLIAEAQDSGQGYDGRSALIKSRGF
ncbi:MAG: hypothetical protein OIF40_00490 [Mangrovicoccus sp.]|nr:hypothetical protein [Mangrovicoccus sp.]